MSGSAKSKSKGSLLESVISTAANKYNKPLVESLSDLRTKDRPIFSTGSVALDYVISAPKGGIESGRVIEIWGENSSGKTTLALALALNVIKTGKAAVHIDAEKALNIGMLSNMGITENFYTVTTGGAREQANTVLKMVQTGEVGIVIVDSLPTWTPVPEGKSTEKDPDVTKPKVGEKANFLGNAIHRLADVCYDTNCLLVLLNQVRANIGGYGAPIMKYPVHSIEHHVSVVLKLVGTTKSQDRQILGANNEIIGQRVTVTVEKNRLDIPRKKVDIPLILGYGVNPYMEIADLAIEAGIILKGGAWYTLGENKVQGTDKVYQYLYENPQEFLDIKKQVIEKLEINYAQTAPMQNPLLTVNE